MYPRLFLEQAGEQGNCSVSRDVSDDKPETCADCGRDQVESFVVAAAVGVVVPKRKQAYDNYDADVVGNLVSPGRGAQEESGQDGNHSRDEMQGYPLYPPMHKHTSFALL
jgi:hypothetical protein